MKQILLALPLLLMVLTACNNTPKKEQGKSQLDEKPASDKGIAFEVFQKIPKEDYDFHFHDKTYIFPEDCTRHFEDEIEFLDDYHGFEKIEVDCFPMNDGNWLVVLGSWGCVDYCGYGQGKAYIYKEGVLKEAPEMLPTPLYEGEKLAKDFYQRHCEGEKLIVAIAGLESDDYGEALVAQETVYSWVGNQFVEIATEQFKNGNVGANTDSLPNDTCDMKALFQAMYDEDETYREFESQMDYATNSMHGWAFSRVDSYSSSLDVSCTPTTKGVFKVVAVVNSTENGEESSLTETYWYKDGVLYEYDDDE